MRLTLEVLVSADVITYSVWLTYTFQTFVGTKYVFDRHRDLEAFGGQVKDHRVLGVEEFLILEPIENIDL